MKKKDLYEILDKEVISNICWEDLLTPEVENNKIVYKTNNFIFSLSSTGVKRLNVYYTVTGDSCCLNLTDYSFARTMFEWERYIKYLVKPYISHIHKEIFKIKKGESYVYGAKVCGELVYIGKGIRDRIDHCNSGVSHNYLLNKAHFSNKDIETVKIIEGVDDTSATFLEGYYIKLIGLENLYNTYDINNKLSDLEHPVLGLEVNMDYACKKFIN